MRSPFPGMDPYLQSRWSDVHAKLIAFIGEALQPVLPADLRARSEERILLETISGEPLRRYRGDVAILETDRPRPASAVSAEAVVASADPIIVEFSEEILVDRFVQVIDVANGGQVVTAIEVLSPWNKSAGRLNDDYCRKLDDYARAGVSIVEIDLLRSSRARLMVTEAEIPVSRRAAYMASVRRGWMGQRWEVYPIPLRDRLPPIPIPLRRSDADVILQLQPLIDRVYAAGGHDDIDYRKPASPPLEGSDGEWADSLLRDAAVR